MIPIIELIALLLVATLGPIGGGALSVQGSKFTSRVIIGLIFGYVLCGLSPWLLLVTGLIVLGSAPGHGHPVGYLIDKRWLINDVDSNTFKLYELEWWQPEILRHHPYLSLALRGMLHLNPAFIVSLPFGMWLALRMPQVKYMSPWRWWEVYKYFVALLINILFFHLVQG